MDSSAVKNMGIKEIESILIGKGIRPTPSRILIMKVLKDSSKPLSALEIEERLQTIDRSSITRTLPILLKADLLHTISDGSGAMKYEACECHDHSHHSDRHAHFYCRVCRQTTCLSEIELEMPELPTGYEAENQSFVISGICPNCKK